METFILFIGVKKDLFLMYLFKLCFQLKKIRLKEKSQVSE